MYIDAVFLRDVFKRTLNKELEVQEINLRYLHFSEHLDSVFDTRAFLGLHSLENKEGRYRRESYQALMGEFKENIAIAV